MDIEQYIKQFFKEDTIQASVQSSIKTLGTDTFFEHIEKGDVYVFFAKVIKNTSPNNDGQIQVKLIGYTGEDATSYVTCMPLNTKYKLIVPRINDYIIVFRIRNPQTYYYLNWGAIDQNTINSSLIIQSDLTNQTTPSNMVDVLYFSGKETSNQIIVAYDLTQGNYIFDIKQGSQGRVIFYKEGVTQIVSYVYASSSISENKTSAVARADKTEASIKDLQQNLNMVWKQIINNHVHAGGHQTITALGPMPLIPISPDMTPKVSNLNPTIDCKAQAIKTN